VEKSEMIQGLKDLIEDRKSFYTKDGDDEIFRHDVEVLTSAINIINQENNVEIRMINFDTNCDDFEYEDFINLFSKELQRISNGEMKFKVEGKNLGWRKLNGYKYIKISSAEDFIEEIFPKTEYSGNIKVFNDRLKILLCHHDSPTGETYIVNKEEGE
jgi:hypothetical protein